MRGVLPQQLEDPGQASSPEVGHANSAQPFLGVLVDRVNGDNVSMLELSQGLWLVAVDRRHLEDHRPIGKVGLFGQEHAREGTMSQFMVETKAENFFAVARKLQTAFSAVAH